MAALHAESLIQSFLEKEMRTVVRRVGAGLEPFKTGEESMSESMLLELTDRFGDVVDVALFTKRSESRQSGADWLWCFETPTGSHFMLVQAKRPKEAMSRFPSSWTINIPRDKNVLTGKTQHQTLLEAASRLGITPCYCLFLPARPTCSCYLTDHWFNEVDDWREFELHYPSWSSRKPGFIHIVKARAFQSEGDYPINRRDPPGITLSALMCCEYSGVDLVGREFNEGYWDMRNDNLTWDTLVAHIAAAPDQAAETFEYSIAGAVRIKITND